MRQTSMLAIFAVLAVVPATAGGQQRAALSKPLAETTESFTQVTSIRELPSGKVLVADSRDKVVQLVDLATGSMTKVGREGNGPGEYALPMALAGLPDGSTLVHDMLNRRFLIVGADGKPGAFLELPRPPAAAGASPGRVMLGGFQQIRGVDNQGRLYFSGMPFSPTGGTADSVPIMRWDRVKADFDTVAYVRLPAGSAQSTQSGGQFTVRMGNNVRFTPAEGWAVAGDGSIARVLPDPYRVLWTGRGAPVAGAVVPYTPIKVTEADKKEVIDAQRRNPGQRIMIGGPPGGGSGPAPNIQTPPPEFAETKPPFESGIGSTGTIQATPEGEVWVLRTRPAGDKVPTYDVFDKSGALVKKVSLNPNSRVAGFGKGTVYVVRTDEDDLQYLQRYARP